jgi:hypothetical protein
VLARVLHGEVRVRFRWISKSLQGSQRGTPQAPCERATTHRSGRSRQHSPVASTAASAATTLPAAATAAAGAKAGVTPVAAVAGGVATAPPTAAALLGIM